MADRWLFAWGLGSISFGGASLLVPLHLVHLGASPVHLGVLASTAAVIGAPGAILFGRFADKVSQRRTLVLVTLATVAATLVMISLLSDIVAVIVANAILWLVVASVAPVLTMLVVDDAPESAWSERIGRLNKFQGYGWAGGLVLGTIWPFVGRLVLPGGEVTRVLFWLLALCAVGGVVMAARSLPRPSPADHVSSERKIRRIARLVTKSRRGIKGSTFVFSPNRLFWSTRAIRPRQLLKRLDSALALYLLAAGLFFTGFAAFWAPLPIYLTAVGFDAGTVFALYLVSSLGSAVLYEMAGTVAARYDLRLLQSGALAIRGALFPAVALISVIGAASLELGAAALGLIAIGLTWAVIAVVGTSIVSRLAPPGVRGEVLGAYTALAALAGGVGGLLGGWTATYGYWIAFGVAGGLTIIGALLVLTIRQLSWERATHAGALDGPAPGSAVSGSDRPSPTSERSE